MIQVFRGAANLQAYLDWLDDHQEQLVDGHQQPKGFLIDRHRDHAHGGDFGGQIHVATCGLMNTPRNRNGAMSDFRYKACAEDLDEVRDWAAYVHDGTHVYVPGASSVHQHRCVDLALAGHQINQPPPAGLVVYRYRMWNIATDTYDQGTRMGTLEAIRDIVHGDPVEDSETVIDAALVGQNPNYPGLTEPNFIP